MKNNDSKCRLLLCGVLFLMLVFAAGWNTGKEVLAADVSLVKGERIEYMGYSTHYYYVDGNLAYCLEPDRTSPGNGNYQADEIDSNDLLAKAMYYVYGGPGYSSYMEPTLTGGWDRPDLAYCLSHCILSYIYDGCTPDSAGFTGLHEDIRKAVIQYTASIRDWPEVPEQELSLSSTDLTAYFEKTEGRQRTTEVQCQGDERNSVTFTLPDGVKLVNLTRKTEESGSVTVRGNDRFYFAADAAYHNGGIWQSGPVQAAISQEWRTLVVKTGGGSQDIGSGHLITVEPSSVAVQVRWIPKPELAVDKKADKADKRYKVGDVITYTTDITQRMPQAVAKNVMITDTIITEGVKLQKQSVVLLDGDRRVIPDADIQVKGNSFSIQAGEFLQSIETGERYIVEYQVVITDESLVGREIENEVIVSADNTEETKDEEIVEVEEPEPGPEVEEPEPEPKPEVKEPKPEPEVQFVDKQEKAEPVKTGDQTEGILLIGLLILSCAAIFTCVKIASKTK